MGVTQIGSEGVDLINLAQYRDKCQAAVNTAINNELHKMRRTSWLAEALSASLERTLLHEVS